MLNAAKYTIVNDKLIPTGALPEVKGTPMDFTTPKKIGRDLAKVPGAEPGGYDHNYVLNKSGNSLTLAATAYDSASGRIWRCIPPSPAYSFIRVISLMVHSKAAETELSILSTLPSAWKRSTFLIRPISLLFLSAILKPGDTYHQTTVYKFSTK